MNSGRAGLAALAVVAAACATACTGDADDAAPAVATWTVTPELTIGGADEGPTSFSDLRGLGVDGQGRIYVLDAQEQVVRVFDEEGAFVRQVGRSGGGPGEFRQANGIAVDRDDRLWVYDQQAMRVTIFDSGGKVAATHALHMSSFGYVWPGTIDTLGHLYDVQFMPADTSYLPRIRRVDFESGRIDTLPLPDCPAEDAPHYSYDVERASGTMSVPFASGEFQQLDPAGYQWCGDTGEFRIARYPLGDSVPDREISATVRPAEVTQSDRDSAIAEVEKFGERAGAAWDPDLSRIPSTKPVVQTLDFDDAGRIWVRAETAEGKRLFIFDSTGRQLAQAAFPYPASRWIPLVIRGDRIYAISTDSLDLPAVMRFRVATR